MENSFNYTLIREIISACFIITGTLFMFISTIGLLRFPDFYIRMSAITKGATLGVGLILLGMAIYFNKADILLKVGIIITFTFITAPVAAHVIARTALYKRVPFWKETRLESFREYLKQYLGAKDEEVKD